MAEHAQRYDHVAASLNGAGVHVYANDNRGHRLTGTRSNSIGDFVTAGWNGLVDDMVGLTRIAREREHGRPVILLGRSMGSIAAQQYIIERSRNIVGVALPGSVATDGLAMNSPDGELTAFNEGLRTGADPLRLAFA